MLSASWLLSMFRDRQHPQQPPTRCVLQHPSPVAELPAELVHRILLHLVHISGSSASGHYNCTPLLLSSAHRRTFQPIIYSNIFLTQPRQFRLLRETLALHNPELGKLVKGLVVAATAFDLTGYGAEPIAHNRSIAVGLEQFMLDMPNLDSISLDLYSLAALTDANTNHCLDSAPRVKSLKTELLFPQYFDVPVFEDLEDLEIVCFGLDKTVCQEFRNVLPRLKRLTIRLVTRTSRSMSGRPPRGGRQSLLGSVNAYDDGDYDSDDMEASQEKWSDTTPGKIDADAFVEALDLLRTWPNGERASGTRLESITILGWPAAVRELHERYRFVRTAGVRPGRSCTDQDVGPSHLPWSLSPQNSELFPAQTVVQTAQDLAKAVERQTAEIVYFARHHLKQIYPFGLYDSTLLEGQQQFGLSCTTDPLPNPATTVGITSELQQSGSEGGTYSATLSPSAVALQSNARLSEASSSYDRNRSTSDPADSSWSPSTQRIFLQRSPRLSDVLSDLSQSSFCLPPAPLRIDLDPYREYGPRRGSVRAWMEEF